MKRLRNLAYTKMGLINYGNGYIKYKMLTKSKFSKLCCRDIDRKKIILKTG